MGTLLLAPGGITLSPRLREIAILRIAQQCGRNTSSPTTSASPKPLASPRTRSARSDYDGLIVPSSIAPSSATDTLTAMSRTPRNRPPDEALVPTWLVELGFCIGHWGMLARPGAAANPCGRRPRLATPARVARMVVVT
jgi:hypothetical protein